jgi:hypothetical protein
MSSSALASSTMRPVPAGWPSRSRADRRLVTLLNRSRSLKNLQEQIEALQHERNQH